MSATTGQEAPADGGIGRGWVWFTTAAMAAIFFQSVTAGRILDGDHWALTTHRAIAGLLVLVVLAATVTAFAVLRERTGGRRMSLALVALAVAMVVQYGLGAAAADGRKTLWLHIPIGVAIVALAAQAHRLARRLAELPTPQAKGLRHD